MELTQELQHYITKEINAKIAKERIALKQELQAIILRNSNEAVKKANTQLAQTLFNGNPLGLTTNQSFAKLGISITNSLLKLR